VKVVVRIESAEGVVVAAPSPCRARAAINDSSLQARPQRSEPTEKMTRPAMNTPRRPRMSASRPPSSKKPPNTRAYALITHCRFSCENPRSA
jgi:hypothetical protein